MQQRWTACAAIAGAFLITLVAGKALAQTDYDPRYDARLEGTENIKSGGTYRVTLVYNGTEEFYNYRYALDTIRYLREIRRAVERCDKQAYDHAVKNLEALYEIIQQANARKHREWEAAHPEPSSDEKYEEQQRYDRMTRDADAVYQVIHTHLERFEAKTSCPASKTVGLGGWTAEVLAYGGGVSAESFGTSYHTDVFGGRAAVGVNLPYQLRAQLDVEGEATGSYCTPCNSRSEISYATHLDWKLTPQIELGAFGGLQNAHPTFNAPNDTNYFLGGEARYNGGWWLAGIQAGYFDVAHGPGTIDKAWFVEGRAKVALGQLFGASPYFNPVLGGSVGYAEGDLSTTSLWATSTQWSVTLAQRISGTPATAFVGFHHYTNRVETLGTVWDESILKTGIKFDLSGTSDAPSSLEATQPLPFIALRTALTF